MTRLQIQRKRKFDAGEKPDRHPSRADKDLLALARQIYERENGLSGLYDGVLEAAGKAAIGSVLRALAYTYLHKLRAKHSNFQGALSPADRAAIGLVAGLIAVLLTAPIATVVTRKQVQGLFKRRERLPEIISRIYSERGLKGFWAGCPASLVLSLNLPLTFVLHQALKIEISRSRRLNTVVKYSLWILSHVAASSLTYPFSVVKTRSQVAQPDYGTRTIHGIAQAEGPKALYSGLSADIVRSSTGYIAGTLFKDIVHSSLYQAHYLLSLLFESRPRVDGLVTAASMGITPSDASAWGTMNETADLVGDYVEDEAKDWRSLYHWFWDTGRRKAEVD